MFTLDNTHGLNLVLTGNTNALHSLELSCAKLIIENEHGRFEYIVENMDITESVELV